MGSRCAKLSTGHSAGQSTGHSRGYESSMKKLVACVSQDNFSLSFEDEDEEEEEPLPVQGKLLLMEAAPREEHAEDGAEDGAAAQPGPEPKETHF